jgi:hypothetical protein
MIGQTALIAALLTGQAAATPRPCVTQQEAGAIAAVAMPSLVDALAQRCSQHLPETAFLRSGATALVERWRGESASQREQAFAALTRMGAARQGAGQRGGAAPASVDGETIINAMIGGFAGGMSSRLNAASCTELSRFIEALSPLPASNVAQMVSALMGFGVAMTPQAPQGGPPICRP